MSSSGPLVEARDLAAGYNDRAAIEHLTFTITRGERVALLGPNGGGKTTLLRVLLGELDPLAGSLQVRARRGVVPQTERSRLDYPVSALDVVLMGTLARLPWWRRPGRSERQAAREALRAVGLGDSEHATFGELSGGQRQRVLIARGLAQEAEILLLDEPFTGLDTTSAAGLEELIASLASSGRSVVVAGHDLQQAHRMDRVLCVNHRQIAFGEPSTVLDLPTLEATYGGAIVELPDQPGRLILPPHHHEHAT
ncbi:MAG TPA: metal ABC transporter ATP-binding protein [Solirubrobacterales bacterium]|jgi:ABC-type Mn2+/Zn2+ transport system ATPase subunit